MISCHIIMYTLPLAAECCHLAHVIPVINYSLYLVSQLNACSSHCEVCSTKKTNHRPLQVDSPHKWITLSICEGSAFWALSIVAFQFL